MAIIRQYHKDTNTTYVYESISYWDEEKKQSRSKRRVIGKVDPETGEVIPTGKRGRKKKVSDPAQNVSEAAQAQVQEQLRSLEFSLRQKELKIAELEKENRSLKDTLKRIHRLLTQGTELCDAAKEI